MRWSALICGILLALSAYTTAVSDLVDDTANDVSEMSALQHSQDAVRRPPEYHQIMAMLDGLDQSMHIKLHAAILRTLDHQSLKKIKHIFSQHIPTATEQLEIPNAFKLLEVQEGRRGGGQTASGGFAWEATAGNRAGNSERQLGQEGSSSQAKGKRGSSSQAELRRKATVAEATAATAQAQAAATSAQVNTQPRKQNPVVAAIQGLKPAADGAICEWEAHPTEACCSEHDPKKVTRGRVFKFNASDSSCCRQIYDLTLCLDKYDVAGSRHKDDVAGSPSKCQKYCWESSIIGYPGWICPGCHQEGEARKLANNITAKWESKRGLDNPKGCKDTAKFAVPWERSGPSGQGPAAGSEPSPEVLKEMFRRQRTTWQCKLANVRECNKGIRDSDMKLTAEDFPTTLKGSDYTVMHRSGVLELGPSQMCSSWTAVCLNTPLSHGQPCTTVQKVLGCRNYLKLDPTKAYPEKRTDGWQDWTNCSNWTGLASHTLPNLA